MNFFAQSAAALFALLLLVVPAHAESYRFDSAKSKITFTVKHLLGTVKGSFGQFSGKIELDRDAPENSSVSATIKVKSIDTGIAKRDEHMLGPEFFDAAKFPEITFKSRSAKQTGKQAGDLVGDFTLHGVTRPITLHVSFLGFGAGEQTTRWRVTAEPINRYDFALRWSDTTERVSMIGREVGVEMTIEAELVR